MTGSLSNFNAGLRPLFLLGRVSNLPTVWSNCLAGWLISGGGETGRFLLLCLGATLLYLAGMYLNDAVDVQFDRMHRPDRPIPAGTISAAAVWQWGLSFLGLGLLCFGLLGGKPLTWAVLLSLCILLYDLIHKIFFLSPILMAACRFFLILTAASVTEQGVNGYSIWVSLVLGAYIVGLSYLARKESVPAPLQYWPCIFLAAPLVLGMVVNRGPVHLNSSEFVANNILNLPSLANKLNDTSNKVSQFLKGGFSAETIKMLTQYIDSGTGSDELKNALGQELSKVVKGELIFRQDRFADVKLSEVTEAQLNQGLVGEQRSRLNQLLLQDAFPQELQKKYIWRGVILGVLLFGWILQSLRHCYWAPQPNVGRSVAALLAGIVLVDLLAVGGGSIPVVLAFLFLFGISLFFQRFIPAT